MYVKESRISKNLPVHIIKGTSMTPSLKRNLHLKQGEKSDWIFTIIYWWSGKTASESIYLKTTCKVRPMLCNKAQKNCNDNIAKLNTLFLTLFLESQKLISRTDGYRIFAKLITREN